MEIHAAWLDAVHVHSRDTPTLSVPVPPLAPKVVVEPLTLSWHRDVDDGDVTLVVLELPHATTTKESVKLSSSAGADVARETTARRHAQGSPARETRARPFDAVVDWNFSSIYQCEQSCAGKSTVRFCLCSSPFPF